MGYNTQNHWCLMQLNHCLSYIHAALKWLSVVPLVIGFHVYFMCSWPEDIFSSWRTMILFDDVLSYGPCYYEPPACTHICTHSHTQTKHTVLFVSTDVALLPLPYLHCGGPPSAGPSPVWWPTCGRPHGHAPSLPRPVGPSRGARWKTPHYQSGSDLPGKRWLQISVPLLLQRTVIPLEPVIIVCLINWKI